MAERRFDRGREDEGRYSRSDEGFESSGDRRYGQSSEGRGSYGQGQRGQGSQYGQSQGRYGQGSYGQGSGYEESDYPESEGGTEGRSQGFESQRGGPGYSFDRGEQGPWRPGEGSSGSGIGGGRYSGYEGGGWGEPWQRRRGQQDAGRMGMRMEDGRYRGESEWDQPRQSRGGYGQGSEGRYAQRSQGGFGQSDRGGFSGGPSSQGLGRRGRAEGADYRQQRYAGSYGLGRGGQRGEEQRESFGSQGESFDSRLGRFFGKGPKGYQRSDERIKEEISDRLEEHGDIDASEITVMVAVGEVTLEGTVPDRWMKRLAEDVAEDTAGVKQVHNRVRIEQGHGSETSGSSSSRDKSASFGSSSETTSGTPAGTTSGSSSGTTPGSEKSRTRSNA